MPADPLQTFETELHLALNSNGLLVNSQLSKTSCCSTKLLITPPGIATRS